MKTLVADGSEQAHLIYEYRRLDEHYQRSLNMGNQEEAAAFATAMLGLWWRIHREEPYGELL